MRLLMCCVLSVVTISPVCADIMLTTTSGLSFAQNSGIHSFQLFGKSAPTDPAITSLISTTSIDSGTSGLEPGFYSIFLTDNSSDGVGVTGLNGQFEIVSIPEPSVLVATGIGIGIIFYRRRRDRTPNYSKTRVD